MPHSYLTCVNMLMKPDQIDLFTQVFLNGFKIEIKPGMSIKELLVKEFGLAGNYIEHRIQTIFLNGKAVDNINTSNIQGDSTLALSAAMPGLVGATFRRSGMYASMRQQISHTSTKGLPLNDENEIIYITIKLFNLIAKEMGSMFLSKGVVINGKDLRDMISFNQKNSLEDFGEIYMDESRINPDQVFNAIKEDENIFLSVFFT